jgi:hypothetical protein
MSCNANQLNQAFQDVQTQYQYCHGYNADNRPPGPSYRNCIVGAQIAKSNVLPSHQCSGDKALYTDLCQASTHNTDPLLQKWQLQGCNYMVDAYFQSK